MFLKCLWSFIEKEKVWRNRLWFVFTTDIIKLHWILFLYLVVVVVFVYKKITGRKINNVKYQHLAQSAHEFRRDRDLWEWA